MTYYEILSFIETAIEESGQPKKSFAQEIKVPKSTFYKWLAGRNYIPYDFLTDLLDILGYELTIKRKDKSNAGKYNSKS